MIRRSTWIMLGIFGLVLVVALFIQRTQQQADDEATPTPGLTYLFDVQESTIIALRITGADEVSVAVQRNEEGNWVLLEAENEQADQDRIGSAISQAETLRVLTTLEEEPDLDVIGLDHPQYRVSITLADGGIQVAVIGRETPTGSGYYARLEGNPLQVVNKSSVDSLLEILTDPPIAPTPTPEP